MPDKIDDFEEFNQDKTTFEFYIDEEEKSDISDKFQLVKEHVSSNNPDEEVNMFGFQVIDQYLFIKR